MGRHPKALRAFGLAVALAVGSDACAQQTTSAVKPTGKDRLVGYFLIGGSTTRNEDRRVGWGIKTGGWQGFVDTHVQPVLDWGVRRVELHNPFGTLPREVMQFDQYLEAQKASLTWLYKDFVSAWSPLTSGQNGPKVEVIAYLGSLVLDQDFKQLLASGDLAEWHRRAWKSLEPAMQAGMSIGFDAVTSAPADHPAYQFIKGLRDSGVRVYVEGWPSVKQPHWCEFNVIVSTQQIRKIHEKWAVPQSQIKGEIVRLGNLPALNKSWKQTGWELPEYSSVLRSGFTAAIPVRRLLHLNIDMTKVLEAGSSSARQAATQPVAARTAVKKK